MVAAGSYVEKVIIVTLLSRGLQGIKAVSCSQQAWASEKHVRDIVRGISKVYAICLLLTLLRDTAEEHSATFFCPVISRRYVWWSFETILFDLLTWLDYLRISYVSLNSMYHPAGNKCVVIGWHIHTCCCTYMRRRLALRWEVEMLRTAEILVKNGRTVTHCNEYVTTLRGFWSEACHITGLFARACSPHTHTSVCFCWMAVNCVCAENGKKGTLRRLSVMIKQHSAVRCQRLLKFALPLRKGHRLTDQRVLQSTSILEVFKCEDHIPELSTVLGKLYCICKLDCAQAFWDCL